MSSWVLRERLDVWATQEATPDMVQDLAADLAPGARVTTPDTPSRLQTIDQISWQSEPVSLAVLASTELADGTHIQTRLHLTVTQQTRWFITAINPTKGTP